MDAVLRATARYLVLLPLPAVALTPLTPLTPASPVFR